MTGLLVLTLAPLPLTSSPATPVEVHARTPAPSAIPAPTAAIPAPTATIPAPAPASVPFPATAILSTAFLAPTLSGLSARHLGTVVCGDGRLVVRPGDPFWTPSAREPEKEDNWRGSRALVSACQEIRVCRKIVFFPKEKHFRASPRAGTSFTLLCIPQHRDKLKVISRQRPRHCPHPRRFGVVRARHSRPSKGGEPFSRAPRLENAANP